MIEVRAVREFNEYGYVWYPQIWIQALGQWIVPQWVKVHKPEGFKVPESAINFFKENN